MAIGQVSPHVGGCRRMNSQCIGKRFRLECRTVGQSGKKLATRATFAVPYAGHLRGRFNSWEGSLRQWLTQLPSAETRRYVGIFLSVYRVRPGADVDANSDDDDVDEPSELDAAGRAKALQTQTPPQKKVAGKAVNDDRWKRRWRELMPGCPRDPRTQRGRLNSAAAQKAARQKPVQPPAGRNDEPQSVPGRGSDSHRSKGTGRAGLGCMSRKPRGLQPRTARVLREGGRTRRRRTSRGAGDSLGCFGTFAPGFAWKAWYREIAHLGPL